MMRRTVVAALGCVALSLSLAPAGAAFDWNGTWKGTAANGRSTEIAIAGNKVKHWKSNGQVQPLAKTSVSADSVTIKHAEGATVTLRARKDGGATYSWRGTNGSSTAILRK